MRARLNGRWFSPFDPREVNNNYTEATKLQLKYLDLISDLFIEVNPIPVKTAMNLLGWNVGDLRLPLCEMEEGNVVKLKEALTSYGLKLA